MANDFFRKENFDGDSYSAFNQYLDGAKSPEASSGEIAELNFDSQEARSHQRTLQRTTVTSIKLAVDEMFTERLRANEAEIKAFRKAYPELAFPEIDQLLRDYPAKVSEGEENVSI